MESLHEQRRRERLLVTPTVNIPRRLVTPRAVGPGGNGHVIGGRGGGSSVGVGGGHRTEERVGEGWCLGCDAGQVGQREHAHYPVLKSDDVTQSRWCR